MKGIDLCSSTSEARGDQNNLGPLVLLLREDDVDDAADVAGALDVAGACADEDEAEDGGSLQQN